MLKNVHAELISPGDYNEKLSAMSLTVWLCSYVDLGPVLTNKTCNLDVESMWMPIPDQRLEEIQWQVPGPQATCSTPFREVSWQTHRK